MAKKIYECFIYVLLEVKIFLNVIFIDLYFILIFV